jgi:hypothetical protein
MIRNPRKRASAIPPTFTFCFDALYNSVVAVVAVLIVYTIISQYGPYVTSIFMSPAKSSSNSHPTTIIPISKPASSTLESIKAAVQHELTGISQSFQSQSASSGNFGELPACDDEVWCNIPMPEVSSYKFFEAPKDPYRWRIAQLQAASGELVLLKEISKVFPNPFDFLDGDRSFRRLHSLIDVFIDVKSGLDALKPGFFDTNGRRLQSKASDAAAEQPSDLVNGSFPWELERRRVIPVPYNYRYSPRAPIVQLGYAAFRKDFNEYFSGNREGGTYISRQNFLSEWKKVKDEIDMPFITVCTLNENWGMLSTMIPNRTAAWGNCCERPRDRMIYDFLNHPKTLMLAINQHSNISHPKVLTLPRGLPSTWEKTAWIVWDLIRYSILHIKKKKLLFASSSSWGPRKAIFAVATLNLAAC